MSREWSRYTNTILVELPCLGIPRLGFVADIMDREKHAEAAIAELDKRGELSFSYLHNKKENLSLLPACVFAVPDYPLTQKVELETLTRFPVHFIHKARQQGYGVTILVCQGQLTSPMTFFAIKHADLVLIPADEPAEIAFSLINIRRLIQIFKFKPGKFITVTKQNVEIITEIMVLPDDESRDMCRIEVLQENCPEIVRSIILRSGFNAEDIWNKKKDSENSFLSPVPNNKGLRSLFKNKSDLQSLRGG